MPIKIHFPALTIGIIGVTFSVGGLGVTPAAARGDPTPALAAASPLHIADAIVPEAEAAGKKRKRFRRFFNFPQVGDGCGTGVATRPNIWFFPDTSGNPQRSANGAAWLGDKPFAICHAGFDPDRTTSWRIIWPDRRISREVVPAGGIGPTWSPEAGMPLGRYEILGEQGARRAAGSLTVTRPNFGIINAVEDSRRIGDSFRIAFVGFPSRRRLQVAVYRATEHRRCRGQRKPQKDAVPYCLTKTRLRVRVDQQGDAVKTYILGRHSYRPGSYRFAARDGRRVAISWPFTVCPRGKGNGYCLG